MRTDERRDPSPSGAALLPQLGTSYASMSGLDRTTYGAVVSEAEDDGWIAGPRLRIRAGHPVRDEAMLVVEQPLELRVDGLSVAVVMRTPGHDLELARGFLLTEGMVDDLDEVVDVRHCDRVEDPSSEDNVVLVRTRAGQPRLEHQRRTYVGSSCGVCGKTSIERVMASVRFQSRPHARVTRAALLAMPLTLRAAQPLFARTGSIHAAGLFDTQGGLLVAREDVGRHNAVDKVVGWALGSGRLHRDRLAQSVLLVSGRISFEIVQKALAAGVTAIAAVSGPSSLAVELASQAGMLLVGFVRDDDLSIYAGALDESTD